jgi:diguanylate cyclase (GGDEF)-like protein
VTVAVAVARGALLVFLALLTVKSFLHGRRGSGPAARWLTAAFAVLTVVTLFGVRSPDLPGRPGNGEWKLVVCLLVLFPWCLGRFTEEIGAWSSRFRRRVSAGTTAAVVAATLALPQLPDPSRRPAPYQLYALAFMIWWTVLSVWSARSLWRAGQSRPTVVRRRMRTLSLGSSMVNVALVLLGSAPPNRPPAQLAVQVLGIVSAALFFVGFAPPAALRAFWRQRELDLFDAAEARLMAVQGAEDVAGMIVPQAVALLGGAASFISDRDGRILAHHEIEPDQAAAVVADLDRSVGADGSGVQEPVPGFLARRLRDGWLVVTADPVSPFFGRDERRLLDTLGHSAELAMERVELWERDEARRRVLEETGRQLAQAQRLARIGSWEWHLPTGRVRWSEEMYRIYELDPETIAGDVDYGWFQSRSHPDDRAAMEEAVRGALTSGEPFHIDHRLVMPDGRIRWLQSRGRVVLAVDGTPDTLQGTAQDITAAKLAEAQLSTRAAQQAVIAELGQRALHGLGMDDLRAEATNLVAQVLDVDAATAAQLLDQMGSKASVVPTSTVDEADVNFLTAVSHVLGAAVQRHRAEAEVAHQALHDPLTGLPNRALLADRLRQAAARARRQPDSLAVLFLDLDRFKVVNDGIGHSAGDELLRVVARRLLDAVRPGDTVARFGGDEFVVLCENLNEPDAAALADRVGERLSTPVSIAGRDVAVTASIGIVVADTAWTSPEDLLRDADTAMYQAKERGRARSQLFDAATRQRVLDRLDTEMALHRAIEREEFRVWYQPEVSLADGRIVGLEALLRWERPDRGLQLPDQFLSLAEETGLIVPIGAWVLEEACRQAQAVRAQWPQLAELVVWVNLSVRQLAQPDLVQVIARVLADTETDPRLLGLEITETVLMEDLSSFRATLEQLRRPGVRLAIDDFGTGFSSLSRLRQFPVDVLKVDRSFVEGVTGTDGDRAIVEAVVGLAHSFDMVAVAEGVSAPDEVAVLQALGCDLAQGFYFCRPLEFAALMDAIAAGKLPCAGPPLAGSPAGGIAAPGDSAVVLPMKRVARH